MQLTRESDPEKREAKLEKWSNKIIKYNNDYEDIRQIEIEGDDHIITPMPASITDKWIRLFKSGIQARKTLDNKIFYQSKTKK